MMKTSASSTVRSRYWPSFESTLAQSSTWTRRSGSSNLAGAMRVVTDKHHTLKLRVERRTAPWLRLHYWVDSRAVRPKRRPTRPSDGLLTDKESWIDLQGSLREMTRRTLLKKDRRRTHPMLADRARLA
ncbi:hypothetical protein PGTUg99_020538 [Puccinia graminis f. sp. tritici]|uniref:Uncharacterized protein n=1 Tax=Puccinia graminis f. sp. tritici TaxID=56615 RepID=A0A5B0M5Y7_PUCGR|nr:hypothetical protein PGTUg99_020538 [Puccinia graminis f. sp. tritici]